MPRTLTAEDHRETIASRIACGLPVTTWTEAHKRESITAARVVGFTLEIRTSRGVWERCRNYSYETFNGTTSHDIE